MYEIFCENLDIFHVSLSSGIESGLFEILCKINDNSRAQLRITKLLIASGMETLNFQLHFIRLQGILDEYFSAFPSGTVPFHINN